MSDYSLSFTAASLMTYETEQLIRLYLEKQDWTEIHKLVVDDNVLQKGTLSTRKREFNEIKKRLKNIDEDTMKKVLTFTSDEIKLFCLYLCCRTYRLMYEFIIEVMRDKYLMFDYMILDSDYEKFIDSKTAASKKLQNISESTQYKIKQVLFRILEQSTLIDTAKNRNIQRPYVSEDLEATIAKDSILYLAIYLYTDADIQVLREEVNV